MFRLIRKRLCRIQPRNYHSVHKNFAGRKDKHAEDRVTLAAFEQILREGSEPTTGIILSSLKACSRLGDLHTGERIHRLVTQNTGYFNNYVKNSLVDMYSKCGSMDQARRVFDSTSCKDVVSWNCIIGAYAQTGKGEVALDLYEQMLHEGQHAPTRVTILAVLKACSTIAENDILVKSVSEMKKWCLTWGRNIHAQAEKAGLEMDVRVASSLVDMYAKCGSMVEARSVFDVMVQRDVVTWNSIMMGYAQSGQAALSLELFGRMQDEGFIPSEVSFLAVLKACSSLAEKGALCLEKLKLVHGKIIEKCELVTILIFSSLVDAYAKFGCMGDARIVFEKMPQHNVVSWNCMVMGYARNGEGEAAMQAYGEMGLRGVPVDAVTMIGALKACASLAEKGSAPTEKLLQSGRAIQCQASRTGHDNIAVESSLVDMYARCGSVTEARAVFDRMSRKDVVAWTAIISGYVESGEPEIALKFYKRLLREEGLVPDAVAYAAALRACGSLAALDFGRQVHEDIHRAGIKMSDLLLNCLVDFYGKCSCMVEAKRIFDSADAQWRNVVSWNTLLTGFSYQGDHSAVLDMFTLMLKDNVKPDGITFLTILSVCTHSGLVDEGITFFEEMLTKYKVAPTVDHYTCMVDMLGRANRLEDAVTMVKGMPVRADEVTWKALMAAAQKWKNAEVAKFAFDKMVELGRSDGGAYVLLANTCAQEHGCTAGVTMV